MARHSFSNRRDLNELFAAYQQLLIKNGYEDARVWPYSFASFKTGEPITDSARLYYRSLPRNGRGLADPFDSAELKRQAGAETKVGTAAEQLNAILNSRAWLWVCRYGRFKNRWLVPLSEFFGGLLGSRRAQTKQTEKH